MSKAWFMATLLGLTGGVALAKDKGHSAEKTHRSPSHAASTPHRAPVHAHPAPAAPSHTSNPATAPVHHSAPAPVHHAPAPTPVHHAPAPTPVHRVAPVSTAAHAPAAKANSTPVSTVKVPPAIPTSRHPAQSSGRTAHSSHHAESRHSQPAIPKPASVATVLAAPNIASSGATNPTFNHSNSATSVPAGKIGKAIGHAPAPSHRKVDTSQPIRSATERHTDHKHASNRSATHGSQGTSPLPTAPKFETNGKIPAFGSSLTTLPSPSATSAASHHGHTGNTPPRLPSHSVAPTPPAHQGHADHHGPHLANNLHTNDRGRDHHYHSQYFGHSSGPRRSGGLSWLIVGGSSFGRNCYGYGYGPGYVAPAYFYSAPSQVYVSTTTVDPNVSINSYSAGSVAPPQQQQLTPDEFAALPLERQREMLLQALNALEEDFARSPNGQDWSRYLQLATIAKLVTDGEDRPDATLRARLRSVVQLFDEVAANADYKSVSELTSFRVLHIGLHEFAAEEIDRSRRQLSLAAGILSKGLEASSGAQRWRDYLQLDWMIGTEEEMQIDLETRLARFEKVLEKFDRVQADDQFQVVTQPREFGLAHEALRRFVSHLQQFVTEARNAEQPRPEGELIIPAAPR